MIIDMHESDAFPFFLFSRLDAMYTHTTDNIYEVSSKHTSSYNN